MNADEMVGNHALTRELQRARSSMRGDVLRVAVSYRCDNAICPVMSVKMAIVEEPGRKKFQGPNYCGRCREKMAYVGLETTR